MPIFDYSIASSLLTENDKNRIVCLYFSTNDAAAGIDWNKAKQDFGSASVESFKKTTQNMHKRLEAAATKHKPKSSDAITPPDSPNKEGEGRKRKQTPSSQESGRIKKRGCLKVEAEAKGDEDEFALTTANCED